MGEIPHPHVVILGAGFGGMAVAQELAKRYSNVDDCAITIVDQHNFSLFTPMLTEVAGGEVDERDIVCAIRALSPRVKFMQGSVQSIDPATRSVQVMIGGMQPGVPAAKLTLQADHLVIALGSVTNFHGISGVEEHGLTIKSVDEAATIRNRALALLERANEENDPETRSALLTFVVAGGGFSGVETMAALNDLVRDTARSRSNIQEGEIRTLIVQPESRLLPELTESLARYTTDKLRDRGVEVVLNTKITGAGEEYVEAHPPIQGQQHIPTHLFVWAAGVTPAPAVQHSGMKLGKHHGIVVDACCQVPDHPGVWALGDCAEIPEPGKNKTYAPTAQNASREGTLVAQNIVAAMQDSPRKAFVYHPIGELAIVGKRAGVASLYGLHFSGFIAWAMWRAIYLAKLPTIPKRARVLSAWLLDLAFGRDMVALPGNSARKPSQSEGKTSTKH